MWARHSANSVPFVIFNKCEMIVLILPMYKQELKKDTSALNHSGTTVSYPVQLGPGLQSCLQH